MAVFPGAEDYLTKQLVIQLLITLYILIITVTIVSPSCLNTEVWQPLGDHEYLLSNKTNSYLKAVEECTIHKATLTSLFVNDEETHFLFEITNLCTIHFWVNVFKIEKTWKTPSYDNENLLSVLSIADINYVCQSYTSKNYTLELTASTYPHFVIANHACALASGIETDVKYVCKRRQRDRPLFTDTSPTASAVTDVLSSGGLTTAVIVAIVLSALGTLVLIVFIIVFLVRKGKCSKAMEQCRQRCGRTQHVDEKPEAAATTLSSPRTNRVISAPFNVHTTYNANVTYVPVGSSDEDIHPKQKTAKIYENSEEDLQSLNTKSTEIDEDSRDRLYSKPFRLPTIPTKNMTDEDKLRTVELSSNAVASVGRHRTVHHGDENDNEDSIKPCQLPVIQEFDGAELDQLGEDDTTGEDSSEGRTNPSNNSLIMVDNEIYHVND